MFTHEDERRTLYAWATGDFRECKAIVAKEWCVLGDHYHRNKDEHFFLVSGCIEYMQIADTDVRRVKAPHFFVVPRNTYHAIHILPGAILLCAMTEAYDPADEIPGEP